MDELLNALKDGNPSAVALFAEALLVTRDKKLNRLQASKFEKYAPCKIYPPEYDAFHFRYYVGVIEYNGAFYSFG